MVVLEGISVEISYRSIAWYPPHEMEESEAHVKVQPLLATG